jgi:CheY-like chemotaxis protein
MAHEFNNVLMGIQPFAEVIRRGTASDEKLQKAASQIISSVTRGKRVTQEILRFTQPSEPAFQSIVLADWLHQLLPELRAMIGQRVAIEVEAPSRPVSARCDPAQLQQVIMNLVLNARDAMPNGGTITLTIDDSHDRQFTFGRVPDSMTLLAVRDMGSGMTAEVLQNIFEPLFTTKRLGTGLGLALAQQVIARHGGSIHVESAPGKGTTFSILLQAAPTVTVAPTEQPESAVRIRRVLLVEDELAVAEGIAALLEAEGMEVRTVHRGADAPDAVASFHPDAVILDLGLPDMNGQKVFTSLRRASPGLPVVFSSGHGDQAALAEEIESSSVAFLRKPYDFHTLLGVLKRVVGEPQKVAE